MKKNFLFLPLLALLGTTLLGSCSSHLKIQEGALIQVGPKEYTIKEIYDTKRDTKAAAESYYNLLNDVYTQLAVPVDSAMEADVEDQMQKNFYQAAKDNASANSTTVKEEQENLLQGANVDSVDEYRDTLYLAAKKTAAEDDYYSEDNIKENLLSDYLSEDEPYHVKHILVKTSAATGEYHRATISSDEARKLGRVVMRLASGENFGTIAHTASDDTSSATYGDLGIMDRNTSYVSEFKLGEYVWDMKFNNAVTEDKKKEAVSVLGPSSDGYSSFETDLTKYNLFGIPFSSAIALSAMYDIESDETGHTPNNGEEVNYPRNVIFNTYYNNHALSLVFLSESDSSSMSTTYGSYVSDYSSEYSTDLSNTNFKTISELSLSGKVKTYTPVLEKTADNKYQFNYELTAVPDCAKVLTDEQGNPVLVARAGNNTSSSSDDDSDDSSSNTYEGVHFIVNQRDPFQSYDTTLNDYYNVDLSEALEDENVNYLNYIKYSSNEDYNTRANGLIDDIKETNVANSNSSFDVYENTKAKAESEGYVVNVPDNIQTLVDQYIDSTKALNDYTRTTTYDRSWITYMDMLDFQQATVSLNLPLTSLSQFDDGNIPVYIDLSKLSSTGSDPINFSEILAAAFTNVRPDGEYGTGWIYNPAYVGSTSGLVTDAVADTGGTGTGEGN